ncbi:MAG TPA: hypothetical protein VF135_12765, partial [Terriglobales bacterium]
YEKPGEPRTFEHNGGATGGSARLVLYPDQGVVMSWTMNTTDFDTKPFNAIAKVFVDRINHDRSLK